MYYKSFSIFFLVIILFLSGQIFSQTINVPLGHRVYFFIERLETKGVINSVQDGTKPLTRMEVAKYLVQVIKKVQKGEHLTEVEREELIFLKKEFREELSVLGFPIESIELKEEWKQRIKNRLPGWIYRNNRNMFEIKSNNIRIFIDPVFRRDSEINSVDTLSRKDKIYQLTAGGKFWGFWGKYIGFYFKAINTKEWGTRYYPDKYRITKERYGYVNGYGNYIYHDETDSYLYFNKTKISLEIGKDKNRWGYGYYGNLLLSDYATSYDMFKLQCEFWRLKFTYFTGFLRSYPPVKQTECLKNCENILPKYISAHRLEINLTKKIQIGLQESVVYGGRDLELSYLNPIMFFRSAEHYLGDRDNALIGLDCKLLFVRKLKLYGEFLIDDIFIKRLNTKWYGNKFGFLGGFLYVDPFNIENLSIRYEYTRIKPFVYTHTYPINVYKHFSTSLGHRLAPNSDEHIINLTYYVSRRMFLDLSFVFLRHGTNTDNENVGGNINQPHKPGDRNYIGFLEGEVEKKNTVTLSLSYEFLRNLFFRLNFNHYKAKNYLIRGISRGNFSNTGLYFSLELNL
ncbi:hypothetical protein DRQ09_10135 [candidate division KSB1 bacterium]|nr:MAG: hypothetical protein DRQ09_10135 [candidate division KSB1 bacterium]